ncbi:MAG: HEAT repeat domain-containing protein [Elusimicrobiaceae bacterium]
MRKYFFLFFVTLLTACSGPNKCDRKYIGQLQDQDNNLKIQAAENLGKCGNAAALDPLSELLAAQQPNVRLAGVKAISGIAGDNAIEPLATTLEHDSSDTVRAAAATALNQFQSADAEKPLMYAGLFDTSSLVRKAAVSALGECCTIQQFPVIVSGDDGWDFPDDWNDPYGYTDTVVEIYGPAGQMQIDTAQVLLYIAQHDKDLATRVEAVRVLGLSTVDGIVPVLVNILTSDTEPKVRSMAAQSLGNIGDLDTQTVLEKTAEQDPDPTVKEAANLALSELNERF